MEDEKESNALDKPGSSESGHSSARKSKNLRDATVHLKEEALRRYKDKIKYDDADAESSEGPTQSDNKLADQNTDKGAAALLSDADGGEIIAEGDGGIQSSKEHADNLQSKTPVDDGEGTMRPNEKTGSKTPVPPPGPKPADASSRASRPVTPKQPVSVSVTAQSSALDSQPSQPGDVGDGQHTDPHAVTDGDVQQLSTSSAVTGKEKPSNLSGLANAVEEDSNAETMQNTNNNANGDSNPPSNTDTQGQADTAQPDNTVGDDTNPPTTTDGEGQQENTQPDAVNSGDNQETVEITQPDAVNSGDNQETVETTQPSGVESGNSQDAGEATQPDAVTSDNNQETDQTTQPDAVTSGDNQQADDITDGQPLEDAPAGGESQESTGEVATDQAPSDEVSPPLTSEEPGPTSEEQPAAEAPPGSSDEQLQSATESDLQAQVESTGDTSGEQEKTTDDEAVKPVESTTGVTKEESGLSTEQEGVKGETETEGSSQKIIESTSETKVGEETTGDKEAAAVVDGEKTAKEGGQIQASVEGQDATPTTVTAEGQEQPPAEEAPVDGEDPNIRGDEYEVQSDAVKSDDNKEKIPANFFYEFNDHVSVPTVTDDSGLPADMLVMNHSFGYDCEKRANLHILDQNTIMFVAGNIVQIVDINSMKQQHIRSTSDGGVGAVAVHPSRKFLAVAEKGTAPNINIYTWPGLKLYRIMRGGTQEAYAYVDFSPDGELLASVGSDPDYMLTLWDWKQEQTVLRSKAFSQDVFRVSFSSELEGQLTSSGTGHIRFWKMADTFTGLKLQGQLGKFGKTEISDIEGYVELPDGKVLSGSEGGNMLLWDGGLIKVEISRKGRKSCHHGPIMQIVMDEGELMTVGEDGFIRVWDFETIDTADTTDEDALFEMEPMNELKVGHGHEVRLRGIVKCVDSEEPTIWFAQDMNGGVWKLDLSFSHTSQAPEKMMTYHAGAIRGCAASPVTNLVASVGADSIVRVYDYLTQQSVAHYGFNSGGSCILWAPQVIDTKGGTIICGFDDGVVRVLVLAKKDEANKKAKDKEDSELLLGQVLKPHTKKVTAMALDNTGEVLATGSEDNTIFFLSVKDGVFEPIGFINIPGPVSHMIWSPGEFEKTTLLVSCQNGVVLEIDAPEPGTYNTEHSYLIKGLNMRTHQFKSVKSRLRHEEELERKRLEEEEKKRQKERERQKMIDRGIEPPEEEEEEEEDEKAEEEEWKPFIPSEPSPIHFGFYSKEPGTFWLSMGDFDAGYLYECKFLNESEKASVPSDQLYEPIRTVPVNESKDVPIVQVHFDESHDGHQMIMGMEDGAIRIQPLQESNDLSSLGPYWSLHMHDNHYGRINQIATSFDGNYLFSVGNDGNFFSYNFMGQKEIEEQTEVNKAKIPSAKKIPAGEEQVIEDIDDPSHYSIEDAKQKAEYDKMMKLAEEKKQGVRRTIAQLRRNFKKLMLKNDELPPHLQLSKKEFEMDPEIKKELEKQTKEKIDLVRKEMAWDAEKHQIQLDKLRQRFKAVVECERIVVKSFRSPHEVSSFRAAKLDENFFAHKSEMERRRALTTHKELTAETSTDVLVGQKSNESLKADGVTGEDTQANIKTTLKGSMGERITKALEKVEAKKKKRAVRKAEWDHLYTNKPDDDYEDPADVTAIKEAQDNMGDFKLKTADDYVVPDHLRMNVEKARFKLMILKDLIHERKYAFNQKLLALRDKKIRIIDEIKNAVAELKTVQIQLGPEKSKSIPSVPELHPDEVPERKMEYTRESLLLFKERYEKQLLAEKMGTSVSDAAGGGGGGFGGFGGGSGAAPSNSSHPSKQTVTSMRSGTRRLSSTISSQQKLLKQHAKSPSSGQPPNMQESHGELDAYNELLAEESGMTELEMRIKMAEEIRLLYRRDTLLSKIENTVKLFDAELRVLGHEKAKCGVDLKNADLRHVTLFEELMLLKEYEKHENVLAEKLELKQREKLDMHNKIIENNDRLATKQKEIEKLLEKEKALDGTFMASLGDNNKFADYLTKVFKKKIKRKKAKATEDGGSDEESDEDSSDDDSDWDEDDESDSEGGGYDLDICPAGCDQALYDSTCQLREKRLDLEEALTEEKKNRDQLKKDGEQLQKKAKAIQGALKMAEADLEAFQLEKQQKLNELDIVVTHKLHQIQHVVNGVLPQDLSSCLVFELPDVTRLQHRIKELEQEKSLQKKQQKEAKKKHVNLIKDRKLFLAKIEEMNEACDKAMIAKFGRIVDLERLEQVTVNRNIEELKEKLRINEVVCSEEIAEWEKKISRTKDEITALTRQNTERLEMLNMLTSEKKVLQSTLDSRQKHLGGEYSGARKTDLHERQRLIQLVQLQAQEVEALKEEIMLLSRKGGHILPPAQPPLPPGNRVGSSH